MPEHEWKQIGSYFLHQNTPPDVLEIVADQVQWEKDVRLIRAARQRLADGTAKPALQADDDDDGETSMHMDQPTHEPEVRARVNSLRPEPFTLLPAFRPADDDGSPDAPPEWIVADWLPIGRVTLFYADGGTGKTTATQQLMTACQTGLQWFGMDVMPCNTVALLSEDSVAEIRHRQFKINDLLGIGMHYLGDAEWLAGIGADNALVRFNHKTGECALTQRFLEFSEIAQANGARLIVIDAAAAAFGNGNENDRSQVSAFITKLTRLAMDLNAAVLLLAHPSRSGIATGRNDSGSTHWHNACRSRWSFVRPRIDEGIEDDTRRTLTLEKANWAQRGQAINVAVVSGLFQTSGATYDPGEALSQNAAKTVFCNILRSCDDAGIAVSMNDKAGNYAPKVFAKRTDANGINKRSLELAMHALLADGTLYVAEYGRPSNPHYRLAFKAVAEPDP
jgi:RecA-family ATPase